MKEKTQREIWVDYVKVVACVLVVLGHFFQSMTLAGLLPANALYRFWNQTIYYFHVPLFFLCSGYLYQKYSHVRTVDSWRRNVLKKAVALGIPYVVFSTVTWFLKAVFSDSVNTRVGGYLSALIISPLSPYWYLYALFVLFFVTPTFQNRKEAVLGLIVASMFKVLGILGRWDTAAVQYFLDNEIWFVMGMCLRLCGMMKSAASVEMWRSAVLGTAFAALSVIVFRRQDSSDFAAFSLGVLGCFWIILLIRSLFPDGKRSVALDFLSEYTMPIYLMHTIFAAAFRTLLLKAGVNQSAAHVIGGLVISFAGPIAAAVIMRKSGWMEFFLYPRKFLSFSGDNT